MNSKFMKSIFAIGASVFILIPSSFAESSLSSERDPRSITTTGEAKIIVIPDIAHVSVTIETREKSSNQAREEQEKKVRSVIAAIKAKGVDSKDMQTSWLDVSPQYDYSDGQQQKKPSLFRAYQSISVTIRDINKVPDFLGSVIDAGATSVGGVRFDIEKRDEIQDRILGEAVLNARKKASEMAKAVNQEIGLPLRIQEGSTRPTMPVYRGEMAMQASSADSSVSVEAGSLSIQADVSATFELK